MLAGSARVPLRRRMDLPGIDQGGERQKDWHVAMNFQDSSTVRFGSPRATWLSAGVVLLSSLAEAFRA
jgi:hypothetical protein